MRLRISSKNCSKFEYYLVNFFGKEKGIIRASYGEDNDFVTLIHFEIKNNYRKKGYGKKLLNALISEIKIYPNIKSIEVVPKPYEEDENVKEMDINELYEIYLRLGFEFEEPNNVVPYRSKMLLTI